jgi:glucosamine-6-phosphate deaminase
MTRDMRVFHDETALGAVLAREIIDGIRSAAEQQRRYVLGCPGGRSPRSVYSALAQLVGEQGVDLRHLVIVMMDDYVVSDGSALRRVDPHRHYSVQRFAVEHLVKPLNRAAGIGRSLDRSALLLPDPARPEQYEQRLYELGGIDLFILASGDSDGHVAFNPPGSAADSRTRIVTLAATTKADNIRTFPDFGSVNEVPDHGVTVGIATIVEHTSRAVLVAPGASKRLAVERIAAADGYDPSWPASVINTCREASVYLDLAARPHPGFGTDVEDPS